MKKYNLFYICLILFTTYSCKFFESEDSDKIVIPEGVTEEQLENARYTYKRDNAYKEKPIYQNKTSSVIVSIFNVINYQIKDEVANIGEGYNYYIFDIAVDNPTDKEFNIGAFTKSCYLGNDTPNYAYSNVSYALKMYHLQSDSAQIDLNHINKFYQETMPRKQFYRDKLFCYEVSKEDRGSLYFRYKIDGKEYEYKFRD